MNLGERLIELRKENGYTREDFAKYIDIPSTTLRNYELGTREPGHPFLVQMAYIFKVSTDYLLGLTDDRIPAYQDDNKINNKEVAHIKKYRTLDEYGQKQVDTTLENEYTRCTSEIDGKAFDDYDKAYDYLTQSQMFAMGGLDIESMSNEELIDFANDMYEMDKKAAKFFK